MTLKIAVFPGDGIGPEVTNAALQVWRRLESSVTSATLEWTEHPAGAQEFLRGGDPLPATTMQACREADAIFLGTMGRSEARSAGSQTRSLIPETLGLSRSSDVAVIPSRSLAQSHYSES